MSVHCFIDCENLDAVLGFEILKHKPTPWERLRYQRIQQWLQRRFDQGAKVVAVLREGDGPTRAKHQKFALALHQLGVQVVWAERYGVLNNLCQHDDREVVDTALAHLIQKSNAQIIVYLGHDFVAAEPLRQQKEKAARTFAAGFPEYMSSQIIDVVEDVFDLESDMGGFDFPLPRLAPL